MRYGFGVDLGGTTVKIAYFDELGTGAVDCDALYWRIS